MTLDYPSTHLSYMTHNPSGAYFIMSGRGNVHVDIYYHKNSSVCMLYNHINVLARLDGGVYPDANDRQNGDIVNIVSIDSSGDGWTGKKVWFYVALRKGLFLVNVIV